MKSLNLHDRIVTTTIMVASIILLAATLVFGLVVKPPSTKGLGTKNEAAIRQSWLERHKAEQTLAQAQLYVAKRVWVGDPQQVGPRALASVNEMAKNHHLKISAFRPQRRIDGDLIQLPYLITVDGAFPNVLKFEKEIERPENRLAVNMVQITSADPNTNEVTGSINVIAYLENTKETTNG